MPEATKNSYGYPSSVLNGITEVPPFRPPASQPEVVPSAPQLDSYSCPISPDHKNNPPPPYPGISVDPPVHRPRSIPIITTQPTYSTTAPGRDTWTDADNDKLIKNFCIHCCICTVGFIIGRL